jgi:hypothetical protein
MSPDEMPATDDTDEATADSDEVADDERADAHPRAPWHFKVLLVGTAGYLVYRLIWFIFWLTGHAWHG